MARGAPVTIDDVEATLRDIEGAGIRPTVRLVHQKLGRGSMSTITAHLRAVAAVRAGTEVGNLPDPVLASLRSAADAIWGELAEAADARIQAVATASESAVAAARAERDAARSALGDLGDEHGALVSTLAEREVILADTVAARDSLAEERDRLERRAELGKRDLATATTRLADRDAELARTLDARARTERALERALGERERAAATHAADTERHATERAALLVDIASLRGKLDTLATTAATRAEALARLETELDARRCQVEELATRQSALQDERDAARGRAERLDVALEQARSAVVATEQVAGASGQTVLALRERNGRLEARLRATGVAVGEDMGPAPSLPTIEGQLALRRDGDERR